MRVDRRRLSEARGALLDEVKLLERDIERTCSELTDAQLRALDAGRRGPRTERQIAAARRLGLRARTQAQIDALNRSRDARRQQNPREYRIWYGMISRCHNPRNGAYKWYGARGITVCQGWRESFATFLADMGPSNGLQIDRIDNGKGYDPSNCRWVTSAENNQNRRSNRRIEWNGMCLTVAQWSRHWGIPRWTITRRLDAGNSFPEILAEFGLPH